MTAEEVEDLQCRLAHQELAIETLSDTVVRQGQMLDELHAELAKIRALLRELRPSPLDGAPDREPPPPHY